MKVKSYFKICILGNTEYKNRHILQYFGETFDRSYQSVIGTDFAIKEIDYEDRKIVLQIWEISSLKRFDYVRGIYIRDASGVIFVFDLTDKKTFDELYYWKDVFSKHNNRSVPVLIIGDKVNINSKKPEVSDNEIKEFIDKLSKEIKFKINYIEINKQDQYILDQNLLELIKQISKMELDH